MKTKNLLAIAIVILTNYCFAQIPILNSNISFGKVVYLDFDGQSVSGTLWNSSYSVTTINAVPSAMSSANIIQIWKRVVEDYRPFDVNITTDSTVFNAALPNKRIRVIITSTSAWFGSAGGVAYLGSFTWGGNPTTPCWVFENHLANNAKYVAEACSHEAGHTFTLRHQSTWTVATCSKTAEYNPGQGSGITSWAPIMGVGYYKNVTTWYKGLSTTSCNVTQYDLTNTSPGLTTPNYLTYLPDDVGDTYALGKTISINNVLLKDSGIITQPTDIDVYKFQICNNRYISIDVKPWCLDTTSYDAANLDVRFQLYDAANNLLATDTSLTKLKTLVGMTLTPGSYYFTIDGGGSANYSDYGSMGKYYIKITSNNVPSITSAITSNSSACTGQAINFTDASSGSPNTWVWTTTGATPATSSLQNPSVIYNTAGVYTITLSATNGTASTCPVTTTINVTSVPALTISAPNNTLCNGQSLSLTGSGATTYTWMPGNVTGSAYVVTPTSTITYTLSGTNGACVGTSLKTLTVSPAFTVNAVSSNTLLCSGQTATLNYSGASTYTLYPGLITTKPATVSPTASTNYTITGANAAGCLNNANVNITVSICTGVTANSTATQLLVYPNPATNNITIKSEKNIGSFEIVNTVGALIYKQENIKESTVTIKTENWAKGIYFLKLNSGDLKEQVVRKIILQ